MKRLFFLILAVLFCPFASTAADFDWSTRGYRILEENGGVADRQLRLADPKGREIEINYGTNELSVTGAERIIRMQELLQNWPGLRLRSLRFFVRPQSIQAIALPDSYVVEGTELAAFMPAGMSFYHGTTLRYNFRMLKDNLSMKLLGAFINREEFASMLLWAIRDPAAFARSNVTGARVDRLEAEIASLKTRLIALADRNSALEKELALVRYAAAFLHNTGFLRGPRPIDAKHVARVFELKKARPALTVKETRNLLEKEGLELSSTVVELIFYFWFNDFR